MTANVLPIPEQAYVYVIGADDGPQKIGVHEKRLGLTPAGQC